MCPPGVYDNIVVLVKKKPHSKTVIKQLLSNTQAKTSLNLISFFEHSIYVKKPVSYARNKGWTNFPDV